MASNSIFYWTELMLFILSYSSNLFCSATNSTSSTAHQINETTTHVPPHLHCSEAPEIIKANTTQTATIIFLHEYGQWGGGWLGDMERVRQPYMKVILPSANDMPITWHNGLIFPAWFDFSQRKDPMEEFDFDGLNRSAAYVHHLIDEEIKHGIKPERIIIGGVSQGAALAVHSALSYPKRLGGVIALTLWKPHGHTLETFFNEVNRDIPIFHGQVTKNLFIRDNSAKEISKTLNEYVSNNVQFKVYEGIHSTCEEELKDVKKFCEKYVGPS